MRSAAAAAILLMLPGPAPVTVGFLMWKPGQRDAWVRLIADFEAAHPGIRVRVEEAPPASGAFHALLVTKLRAQDPTLDAFMIDVVWPAELTAAGYLVPLDDLLPGRDRPRYFPAAVDAALIDGKIMAMPFNLDTAVLYYRTDLLAGHGFSPPETWDELERQVKAIRARRPEVEGYTAQFEQYEGLVCNVLEFVASNGGRLEQDGEPALDRRAEEAVEWIRDHLVGKIAPRGVLSQREAESREVFMQGHAVFHRNWPETWKMVNDPVHSRIAGRVGLAPMPGFNGGPSVSAMGGWQLAIAAHSPRKEAARRLVRFLAGAGAQKRLTLESAHVPALAAVLDDPEVRAEFPHFEALKEILKTARPRPKLATYAAFSDRLQRELYERIAGSGGELGLGTAALAIGVLVGLTVLLARGMR